MLLGETASPGFASGSCCFDGVLYVFCVSRPVGCA